MQLALPPAESRGAEILGLLRSTFADKGFDGASMQDLARAAGMSAGNFYRYFPSKSAIIEALIGQDMAEIGRDFAVLRDAPHPLTELRLQLRERITRFQDSKDGCLWAEIHAAGLRKPEIGALIVAMEEQVSAFLVSLFAREAGLSQDEAAAAFAPQAALIVTLFRSAAMIGPHPSDVRASLTAELIATIEQVLDRIASHRRKVD